MTWPDGKPAEVRLPYRLGTRLAAGLPIRKRGGVIVDRRPLLDYGERAVLRGTVLDADDQPRGFVTVSISERVLSSHAAWRSRGTVVTNNAGTFAYRVPIGPARTIRFEYAATPTSRSASSDIELRVRGATTLRADRRRLTNGQTVVLRGRLKGPEIPSAGKLLTLQARTARGWVTFGTTRARSGSGRWTHRYTFTGTTATSRYQFRVLVPREAAYPYFGGVSKRLSVLVRGG